MAWTFEVRGVTVWWDGWRWRTGHQAVLGKHWLYLPSGVVVCWVRVTSDA